jgi:hypothetical protein
MRNRFPFYTRCGAASSVDASPASGGKSDAIPAPVPRLILWLILYRAKFKKNDIF